MSTQIDIVTGFRKNISSVGPLGVRIQEDGEIVDSAELQIGFTHRGTEELMCEKSFLVGTAYGDRIDFVAPQAGSLAFAKSVEWLSGIEVPGRGKLIRVLLMELGRISSHLFFLGTVANEIGSSSAYQFCLREREKFCDIFELYSGSRLGFGCIQIGGVKSNITEGLIDRIEQVLFEKDEFLEEFSRLLAENPIFSSRLTGLAYLNKELIQENNISGPNARASGDMSDLRLEGKINEYEGVEIPQLRLDTLNGDAYARVWCRLKEIDQSTEIIKALLKNFPSGNHRVELGMNFFPRAGTSYVEIESPRGRFGVHLESDGGLTPVGVRFVTPSLFSLRISPWLLRQEMIEDVGIILGSLDISISEVDR